MIETFLHVSLSLQQRVHLLVRHLFAKLRIDLLELFQQIDSFLDCLFDDFTHCSRIINQRFLFEIANGKTWRDDCLAIDVLIDAGEYAQQRRLARTVQTDNADLRAVKVGKINVFQDWSSCRRTC